MNDVSRILPRELLEEFPSVESVRPPDFAVLERQLGRPPRGEIAVALHCPHSRPAVIVTLPTASDGGALPPLLWLSCPHAAAGVSGFESEGLVKRFAEKLRDEVDARRVFMAEEERFGRMLTDLARSAGGFELAERVGLRGVAGGKPGAVKCLHAHTAYRLAAGERGIVGLWCIEQLDERMGIWCEEIPAPCVD